MDRKEPVPSNALRALYVPHCLEHSVSGSTSDVSIDTPYASKMLPMMAAPTLRIRMLEMPNARGKPRRSAKHGGHPQAQLVGVGLTKMLGWWQMLMPGVISFGFDFKG
jgi:hypothetical protein